jgi:hypothetical protein
MDTLIRHMKAILTAFPVYAAVLLSGCGPGCGTLGVQNTSPCGSSTSSATSTTSTTTSTFSIFGTVSGTTLLGVTINLTGAATGSTTTDVNGTYSFTALPTGSYTVVPSFGGNTFSPASTAVTISGGNVTLSNFSESTTAAVASSLSGTISGAVAENVLITLSGANTGSAVTDAQGNYSFSGLAAGSYTVTPSLAGHTFSPTSHTVTTTSGGTATGINFTEAAAL